MKALNDLPIELFDKLVGAVVIVKLCVPQCNDITGTSRIIG